MVSSPATHRGTYAWYWAVAPSRLKRGLPAEALRREDGIFPHKNSRPDDGHPSGLWEQTPHPRELVLDRDFKVWDYRLE